jgi:hypothetical protein
MSEFDIYEQMNQMIVRLNHADKQIADLVGESSRLRRHNMIFILVTAVFAPILIEILILINTNKYNSKQSYIKYLVTERILVSKQDGGPQAILGITSKNTPALTLFDASNRGRLEIMLDQQGIPTMVLRDEAGQDILTIYKYLDDNWFIQLVNAARTRGVRLETGKQSGPVIKLMDGGQVLEVPGSPESKVSPESREWGKKSLP